MHAEGSLDPAPEVGGAHEPAVRIADPGPQAERVGLPAVGGSWEADREVGDDLEPVRAADVVVCHQPVAGETQVLERRNTGFRAGVDREWLDVSMTKVPPRCWARGRTPTHSLPPAAVSVVGPPPTLVVPTTTLRFGSIRDTVPEYWFATQTNPPATASATGPLPTGIVATTEPRTGSIRETVESSPLATHTAPAPAASATGP